MLQGSEILTKHLRLMPFCEKHLTQDYVNWLNDPDIMQFSEQRHRKHTLESCAAYLKSFQDSPHFFWAIEQVDKGGLHIGNIQAHIDEPNQLAGISILIGEKNSHGRGYGKEAFKGVCDFLFENQKIRKIAAGTMAANLPMLGLMAGLGMRDDGIRCSHYLHSGRPVDIVYRALFRDDWE